MPGNHEYGTTGAAGYFQYFGALAGDPSKGYYSFDLGTWHLIALNSNCARIGGCGAGSPQEQWLKADLARSASGCVLAYWHHPRFSSGQHGNDASYDAFWRDLHSARADVVLSGHDHSYERFAPQDPDQHADADGIREFVVGTGGNGFYSFASVQPNSEMRIDRKFGVLKLTLGLGSYAWQFISDDGSVLDAGSTACSEPTTPSGGIVVSDQFERTVAGGLGSADVGGVWRVNSTARTKVQNGEAVVYGWSGGGQDVQAWQEIVRPDMEVLALVRLSATNPTGGNYKARVVARAQADARNGYYASIAHTPAGAVTWQLSRIDNLGGAGSLSLGAGTLQSSSGAGTSWWIRLRAQGTAIQARYWRDGTSEPTTWKTSVSDSYFASGRPSFGVSTGSGLSTPFPDTGFASYNAVDLSATATAPVAPSLTSASAGSGTVALQWTRAGVEWWFGDHELQDLSGDEQRWRRRCWPKWAT